MADAARALAARGGGGPSGGATGGGEPAVLCLDVGGSSVKSGVVLAGGELIAGPFRKELDSAGPAGPIVASLASSLEGLLPAAAGHDVRGVGVSMPGPTDYARGVPLMRGLGKFESVYGLDLAAEVGRRAPSLAGRPWRWLNDARAFALGELRFGAARGAPKAMFLTLGTGCGSAFAVDGRLVTSGPGVPEGGFVYVMRHGESTLDELLSARGVLRLWREVAAERGQGARGRVEDPAGFRSGELGGLTVVPPGDVGGPADVPPGDVGAAPEVESARDVGLRAAAGDPAALEAFARFGALLADALEPVFAAFRPEVVVLGGKVSESLRFFAAAAREAGAPPLVPAAAPDAAALRGAAAHLLERTG